MKDIIEKFNKNITIQGYKPVDFTSENGQRIQMCKLIYSYEGNGENEIGIQMKELSVPFEYCEKLKNSKFPCKAIVVISCENLTVRPRIEEIKILGVN